MKSELEIETALREWKANGFDPNELYRTLVAIFCPTLEAQARANLEEACRKRQSELF